MGSEDDEFRRANLGSRCEWHPETVSRLLDSYGEKCSSGKGYLKTRDWEDIVKHVNIQCEGSKTAKTMKQCREKVDSLKRRYKLEKRRAEVRGSTHVEWSFFAKLDDIMRSLKKHGNVSDAQSFELVDAMDFEVDRLDAFDGNHQHHQHHHHHHNHNLHDNSHSVNNISNGDTAHNIMNSDGDRLDILIPEASAGDKGKGLLDNTDDTDGLCDVVLNAVGFGCESRAGRLELPEAVEKGSANRRRRSSKGLELERLTKRHKAPASSGSSSNPVQALADALVRFSEVYNKTEVAKMELFRKMNLELAKLRKKRRKNGGDSDSSSSDSSSSASE